MTDKNIQTDVDFLSYIEDKIVQWKNVENLDDKKLEELLGAFMKSMVQDWGGQNIYVKQTGFLSRRDRLIFDEYDGKPETIKRLTKKYGVSEQWVYAIVKLEKKKLIDRTQIKLF